MKCSNCSFENPTGSKFCENCGQPFEQPCPNCGQPVTTSARFCRNCGFNLATAWPAAAKLANLQQAAPTIMQQKILSTRKQIEGERKLVTVLFTDIVGSTALAEKLDPEEWGEIVSGAHEYVSQAVYRYEGTIAQLLGDGVLAFFGAPITHEDDPVRAVNAALDLSGSIATYARELKAKRRIEDFRMRVGLNTGLVVVGNIGTDMHMEYLAVGDTVNLAARLQSAAEPNTILVSENTARLVKHAFDLEFRGTLELKGKTEPVPTHRVVARKSSPESARGIEGLSSPLVGRDRELQLLQSRVQELLDGRAQIVSVIGEAGLGKSRLVAETRKFEVGSGKWEVSSPTSNFQLPTSNLLWLEGRALSFETTTPYAPFISLLNHLFRLTPNDQDAEKYAQLKRSVAEIAPGRESAIAPYFAAMLGIAVVGDDSDKVNYLMPPDLRARVFGAALEFFERLAAQPLVLVFEDLHWADSTSLDLIEKLMELTDRVPLMILALFRPQRQEPSWRFHEVASRDYAHRYTALALEPLDEPSSRALVANLLHIEDLPEKVRALILIKAEGNPFYVEEVIRSLLDAKLVVRDNGHWRATREIENIAVPDTLAGVIAARLDRLDDESKHTAQTAAVIGREFRFDVLADVYQRQESVGKSLANLQRRELIREKTRAPENVYLFKHALTQETAYASVLLSKRRDLHRRVAECLEKRDPTRVHDIARHFLQADEETRALPYLVEAADRAARAYATPEAIPYYQRALEILQKVDNLELARRAHEGLGGALTLANDVAGAVKNYETMLDVAKARNDIAMQVSALNK
ncbi:MAG: AAA family ATPase, partial [Chloroflexi bacterium]|nr:AAA family ATPase [Chloroflexota bacterium]